MMESCASVPVLALGTESDAVAVAHVEGVLSRCKHMLQDTDLGVHSYHGARVAILDLLPPVLAIRSEYML